MTAITGRKRAAEGDISDRPLKRPALENRQRSVLEFLFGPESPEAQKKREERIRKIIDSIPRLSSEQLDDLISSPRSFRRVARVKDNESDEKSSSPACPLFGSHHPLNHPSRGALVTPEGAALYATEIAPQEPAPSKVDGGCASEAS